MKPEQWVSELGERDYVLVDGERSPGTVKITGASRKVGWKIEQAEGESAETLSRKGDAVGKFSLEFRLWVDEHRDCIAEYLHFRRLYAITQKEEPEARSIYHEDLAILGITQFVVEQESAIEHDGKGGAKVKVDCIQWVPVKKKKGGGQPSGGSLPWQDGIDAMKPDPNQDLLDRLAQLQEQLKQTPDRSEFIDSLIPNYNLVDAATPKP